MASNSSQPTLFDPQIEEDICAAKHGGNPESKAANLRANKYLWRGLVEEFAIARGWTGITADEAAARFGVAHNTVAPRCSELQKAGILVPLVFEGKRVRRATRAGSPAGVLIHHSLLRRR